MGSRNQFRHLGYQATCRRCGATKHINATSLAKADRALALSGWIGGAYHAVYCSMECSEPPKKTGPPPRVPPVTREVPLAEVPWYEQVDSGLVVLPTKKHTRLDQCGRDVTDLPGLWSEDDVVTKGGES